MNNNAYDIVAIRRDFPILQQTINGKPLVYLDTAASAQKPRAVIDAVNHFYSYDYANVHRGLHTLSERATAAYESSREVVRAHINAKSTAEIIFVRGTTEAINLVAQSYGRSQLQAGDEILITALEHHSNIVPWQLICKEKGAFLKVIPMTITGELDLATLDALLTERVKLVAIGHISNALGTINPIKTIINKAHACDIPVLIDGAQAIPHAQIDVQALDCDFYAFSGHKAYGPTGIGVLYGKEALLERMPPYQGGGDMILKVTFTETTFNELPCKFEAGTPNIAGAVGLSSALKYLKQIGLKQIAEHEHDLLMYATSQLQEIPKLRLIGTAAEKASVVSFIFEDVHAHDVGTILNVAGVAVRSGHHCAMPVMAFYEVPATVRASIGLYSTREDIDALVNGLNRVREVFA